MYHRCITNVPSLQRLLLPPAVLAPVPLHVIVAVLGDHQGPLLVTVPHHAPELVCIVAHGLVVRLGQELVVQHAVREHEPVALLLELVSTCIWRNLMICVAVMPPLKACLHESREITPTHRFGNLYKISVKSPNKAI